MTLAQHIEVSKQRSRLGQRHVTDHLQRYRVGFGELYPEMLAHRLLNSEIFGGDLAPFGQRRIVIIAGHVRLIYGATVVGTVGKAEVSTTVEHIQVKARAALQMLTHLRSGVIGAIALIRLVPMREHADPVLDVQEGRIRLYCLQRRGVHRQ